MASRRKQAEAELAKVLVDVDAGTYVKPTELTLGDYLTDRWLPATAPPYVGFQTWDDRRRNLENHVVPRLGAVALQDVTPDQLNRLYADLAEGRADARPRWPVAHVRPSDPRHAAQGAQRRRAVGTRPPQRRPSGRPATRTG